jgi:hypothetical protein
VRANVAACEQGALDPDLLECIEGVYRRYAARLER